MTHGAPGKLLPFPWLTESAVVFLETLIEKHMWVVEFGAGGSTIWLNGRCNVVSVENNPKWHAKLAGIGDVRLAKTRDEYLAVASEREWDIAIVDGPWRAAVFEAVWPYVRQGGWFILDNANRFAYRSIHKALQGQDHVTTATCQGIEAVNSPRGVWRTDFWRKK